MVIHMPADLEHVGKRPDMNRPILELGVEDWTGLWHIYHDVARATSALLDTKYRDELRHQLAAMIDAGLIEAAIWSYDPPKRITADHVRKLPTDSELWKSPQESKADEQLRIAATELGRKAYFNEPD